MAANTVADFWRQVEKTGNCWLWRGAYPTVGRYGRFGIDGKKVATHRFSWMLEHGVVPSGMNVLHRCDNPGCVRPDHLFLGTHTDNMRDMFRKGRRRILRGEQQHASKLTVSDVLSIRRRYAIGERQVDLASEFKIDQTTVSKIVLRQAWRHI